MRNQFDFYADPGHGWLKITRDEAIELGIYNDITSFSYTNGKNLFLEEDCDASLFIRKYKEKFNKEPKINFHSGNKKSKIRNYSSFKA